MTSDSPRRKWWQEAIGYQCWPASFKDSNGDGMGDVNGITSKLDYLKDLGIDLIWLSPVYDSPQHDMGYDIRDYEAIWDKYGTVQDMEMLIREIKKRGMRIILDLVINHTSNEHKWFLESSKSRTNDKQDWYLWRDPKIAADGQRTEPNNWRAAFGGSVWTYVAARDQYYLHLALPEQPDLNWQNPETRQAIYESAIRFWLEKGIDGFRVDVVNFYWKDPEFPDAKVTVPGDRVQPMEPQHIMNGPDVHVWLRELRSKITASHGDDIVLIGETPGTGKDEIFKYISSDSGELDMVFAFDILMGGNDWNSPLHDRTHTQISIIRNAIAGLQGYMSSNGKTWTTAFLESHDFPRSVSHLGPGEGEFYVQAAKMLALLSATLSGALFIYQGQEIGMANIPPSWTKEHLRDRASLRYLDEVEEKYPGDETMRSKALQAAFRHGRDSARTPVQWSSEAYAGFSTAEPWMQVNDNYAQVNAADQTERDDTVLSFWKEVLRLRKYYLQLFIRGEFHLLDDQDPNGFSFRKTNARRNEELLVFLNFSSSKIDLRVPGDCDLDEMRLLIGTAKDSVTSFSPVLGPWEGAAYLRTTNV